MDAATAAAADDAALRSLVQTMSLSLVALLLLYHLLTSSARDAAV